MFLVLATNAQAHRHKPNAPIHDLHKPYIGTATWYVMGRTTANGERFRTSAMTCASPFLPFNTMVRVVDLKTEKSVIVRVNDRKPRHGSTVDLTLAAANRLGIKNRGRVRVRVEPMELAEAPHK